MTAITDAKGVGTMKYRIGAIVVQIAAITVGKIHSHCGIHDSPQRLRTDINRPASCAMQP